MSASRGGILKKEYKLTKGKLDASMIVVPEGYLVLAESECNPPEK